MPDAAAILPSLGSLYALGAAIYIVSENRRPQASFAWLFLFLTLPVAGLAIYVLFGRQRVNVGRAGTLERQDRPWERGEIMDLVRGEHEAAMEALEARGPALARLARLVRSSADMRATTSNRMDLLFDAAEKYPRLERELARARSSIHIEYYTWQNDGVTERLEAILAERAAAGVEVRLLYDPIGSIAAFGPARRRRLKARGIDARPFSPLWRLHAISYRNHRKIVVIDGRVGLTGGLNIGEEHLDPGEGYEVWRDTHLCLRGLAARALQRVFTTDWLNATGEALAAERYFPRPSDEEAEGDAPVQLCLSGPDSEWRAIRQQYNAMIVGARRRVRVQSPFFLLDETLSEALRGAALAGVDVAVMISRSGPGQFLPYWAAYTFYQEVAEAGVEVLLYEKGYLHAKTVVVDGEVASVGSGNWDMRSLYINYELNALVYDAGVAGALEAAFERDRAGCRRFDPAAYRAAPRARRLRDSAARLVSPLM